jgi:hypothetical protein
MKMPANDLSARLEGEAEAFVNVITGVFMVHSGTNCCRWRNSQLREARTAPKNISLY